MELQRILPNIIKELVKQTLESTMTTERNVFLKEHEERKDGFYERNLHMTLGKFEDLKVPRN